MYTFRSLPVDFGEMLRLAAEIGFLGVEVGPLHRMAPADVRRMVDDLGLAICGGVLPNKGDVEPTLHDLLALGAPSAMLSLPEACFVSRDDVLRAAERMRAVHDLCARHGMPLLYHNHFWEFTRQFDGETALTLFLRELVQAGIEPQLEVDIYWAQAAGVAPAGLLRELGTSVKRVHIKDGPCTTTEPMTALGTGSMDICSALAANPSIEWHVVELDACATDIVEATKESYRYLVGSGLSTGAVPIARP
jgi:sugar phosphate isomerase/epimerase